MDSDLPARRSAQFLADLAEKRRIRRYRRATGREPAPRPLDSEARLPLGAIGQIGRRG